MHFLLCISGVRDRRGEGRGGRGVSRGDRGAGEGCDDRGDPREQVAHKLEPVARIEVGMAVRNQVERGGDRDDRGEQGGRDEDRDDRG